jgi:protein gp37
MADATKIEWTDSTFNPWIGCTPVGPGCDHCYATALAKRTGGPAYESGAPRRRTTDANWRMPALWNRRGYATCPTCSWRGEWPRKNGLVVVSPDCPGCGAAKALRTARRRVFCASLADVFDNEVDPLWREDLFALIHATPGLDWLLLTKRIGNAGNMLPVPFDFDRLYPNVWLGATVVNQAEAERDVPKLLATPAARRFLSIEPMLGPIDLRAMHNTTSLGEGQPYLCPLLGCVGDGHGDSCFVGGIDWIIVGGESGPHARPMRAAWAQDVRLQCEGAGVPFLFKQWGEYLGERQDGSHEHEPLVLNATDDPVRVGKKAAGRLLDAREHTAFPEVRHA